MGSGEGVFMMEMQVGVCMCRVHSQSLHTFDWSLVSHDNSGVYLRARLSKGSSLAANHLTTTVVFSSSWSGQWKEYKRVYEHILETDKKLDQSRKNLVSSDQNVKQATIPWPMQC